MLAGFLGTWHLPDGDKGETDGEEGRGGGEVRISMGMRRGGEFGEGEEVSKAQQIARGAYE